MSQADHDSRPIDGDELVADQRDQCEVCHEPLGLGDVFLQVWRAGGPADAWSLCDACWLLLRETILVEVTHGPDTPPPEAWTKVRKLRAARRRRWGKADP